MGDRMIDIFNMNISKAVNTASDFYKSWIGDPDFTPESTIIESEDYNCGALCNELEFARLQGKNITESLTIDSAAGDELDIFVNTFIDLPRRGSTFESDANYRARFKFLVTDNTNYRRMTRWSIFDAISYFVTDISKVQVIEFFDTSNLYFQVRFEGTVTFVQTLFMNNYNDNGYLDSNYLGGIGVGYIQTFITNLIQRIKAAGVDFDILFVQQSSFTKTSNAVIGSVRNTKRSDAWVLHKNIIAKTSDATITT